ncbi:hypothetical protein [Kribbella sp. CA-293567]|uniref:hypothetical protein n=1 Tax=Kribbella sp. CA-293567 TaxID=3002436 RepID=UPI0022DD7D7D|nr:hypothetical protein [Kribbella sp. CA-293567]WBQ05008.1 hypothetical protein OX958_34285 [Kribbella sp. CA-293567]
MQYAPTKWGGPANRGFSNVVPLTWKPVVLSEDEVKWVHPDSGSNLRLRFLRPEQPLTTRVDNKLKQLSATPGFQLLSRSTGTIDRSNPANNGLLSPYITFTYRYLDETGAVRVVVDRYLALSSSPTIATIEVSTGGRLEDLAALTEITTRASTSFLAFP